jgi:tetratricopeptide (TPR) repeat protein
VFASASLAAVTLVAGIGWAVVARTPSVDARRIAFPPTINKTGDAALEPVAAMATTLIETGLGEIGSLDVVESPGGAGWVVRSALYRRGDSVQATAQIVDGATGKTVYTIGPEAAAIGDPRAAMERLSQRVVGGVAMLLDPSHGVPGARPLRPPRWDAFREFREGDASWYRERADSAATRFARAAELDTTFGLARIRETVALLNGGGAFAHRADSVISALRIRRGTLSPYEQSYLDLLEGWARGDMEERYQAAVRLSRLAPTSPFVAYLPGAFGNDAGRYRAVATALEKLDPTSEALRKRTFFHQHLTYALHMLGEHERERQFARRAGDMFPSHLVSRWLEVRALAALGRTVELDSLLTECLQLPAAVNSRRPLGSILLWAEDELRAHRHAQAAAAVNARLMVWLAERPPEEVKLPSTRELRAEALGNAGRWPDAAVLLDSLASEDPENIAYLGMRGLAAARLGDTTGARRWDDRLVSLSNGDPGSVAAYRARIAAVRGDRERAVNLLRDAFSRGMRTNALDHADPALESLRGYPAYEELRRPRD